MEGIGTQISNTNNWLGARMLIIEAAIAQRAGPNHLMGRAHLDLDLAPRSLARMRSSSLSSRKFCTQTLDWRLDYYVHTALGYCRSTCRVTILVHGPWLRVE